MLMLNTQGWTIEGIQIFADHADPAQFWYLPGPVHLSRRREDGRAEFTFIKVRAADAGSDAKGGGFLTFSVDLQLDPDLERRILGKLGGIAHGKPKLSAAMFDEGTVRVIALDMDSGAASGAPVTPPPAGSFRAVEKALGATVPSLDAVNRAAFSLTLTQEGAVIIEQAFKQGGTPVGVVYDLKYSGMRPALDVTITADMSRVFEQFAGSVDSQVMFVRGGIDAGFEKLVQDGSIKIEVHDFAGAPATGAATGENKETWALNFFKESLLAQYFTPTLTVGELRGGIPQAESLDAVVKRGEAMRPPPTPAPTKPTDAEPVARPAPPAKAEDSPTAGTGKGGTTPGAVANPPAGAGDSPTAATGQAATAATGATLGSSAAAGVSPTVTAARPPGTPAGTTAAAASADPATPPTKTPPATTAEAIPAKAEGTKAVTAFHFRGIKQEERKTLVLKYNRSEATQRTYAPQGFFGLLAGDLDKASHFIDVDLDDPFFRALEVRVSTIQDLAAIGLRMVEVAMSYGKPTDPGGIKAKDMRFEGQDAPEQKWTVFQNDGDIQTYRYTVQYHFDAAAGFDGAALSYQFGPFETTDRTLVLNPHESIGIVTVNVAANNVDWGQIDRVDVLLANGGRSRTVSLTDAARSTTWKLRLDDPKARAVTYQPTFVMKDRSSRVGNSATTDATSILIDDPFPEGLALQLIPVLDESRTRLAFVDFDYADPKSGFKRADRYRIAPTDPDREVRVGLPAGATKAFRYRVTVVPKTGTMHAGEFIDTTETLIAVAD